MAVVGATLAAAVTPLVLVARHQSGEISWIGPPVREPGRSRWWTTHRWRVAGRRCSSPWSGRGWLAPPRRATVIALAVWAIFPLAGLVAVDVFVLPDLVARYGLVSIPAVVTLAVLAARREPRAAGIGRGRSGLALAAVATWGPAQPPFKYENYRAADDTDGRSRRPGDGVMFLPASMRVGFEVYRHLEPDLDQRPRPGPRTGRLADCRPT